MLNVSCLLLFGSSWDPWIPAKCMLIEVQVLLDKIQGTCQAIFNGFLCPGGPRAPLYIFLHGPAHSGCLLWFAILGYSGPM